jgi:hypothetical protein
MTFVPMLPSEHLVSPDQMPLTMKQTSCQFEDSRNSADFASVGLALHGSFEPVGLPGGKICLVVQNARGLVTSR